MELTDISKEIYQATKRLESAGKEVYKMAKEKAETERDYRLALSKEIMRLKLDGLNVTIIPDTARGNVSELKYKRDLADGKYNSSKQALEALKTQVNALQSILKVQSEV